MEQQPLVTIGIPNYNYAHFIREALDSVAAQDYQPIELLIVDDLSTDNSIEVINQWVHNYTGNLKIKMIKNSRNLGLPGTCNVILQNASGKYFQVLDADDVLLPGKIAGQVQLLQASGNSALVYSNMGMIDDKGIKIKNSYLDHIGYEEDKMPQGNVFEQLFEFNFIPLPSVLVNTKMARDVGGFDDTLQVQDYYLWLKLSEKHEILFQPGNTALYRAHSSSMSNSIHTNPRSVDSVLQIKYRYFHKSSVAIRDIIRKNIFFSAAYLYETKYPSAGYWLKKNLELKPGFKPLLYFFAHKLGIPFSFFKSIRNTLFNDNNTNAKSTGV